MSAFEIVFEQVTACGSHTCAIGWGGTTETARGAWWNTLNPGLTTKALGRLPMVSPDHIAGPPASCTPPPKWKRKVSKVKMTATRLAVYERDQYRCVICEWTPSVPENYTGAYCLAGRDGTFRKDGWPRTRFLELDHIVPFSRGGKFEPDNLQALCNLCNVRKGNRV